MNKNQFQLDSKSNHIKNILHGFFLQVSTTIAEPHTILPLMVSHFGGGSILIGFFASLLRGGAVIIQLYAAFYAQGYPLVLKHLRRVFLIRFLSWFCIGVAILLFGQSHPTVTLFLIGIGLFIFSFSAGFGAIYFKELTAKIFSHKFRGKTMSIRQFFAAFGALLSGAVAGYIIHTYEAPFSYGVLFLASSFLMAFGLFAFATVSEPIKENVLQKEKSFRLFLQNSKKILKSDKNLQNQVITFLLAYSYLFAMPFIILDAKEMIDLDGTAVGMLITSQMVGAMLSNILWGKLSFQGENKKIAHITILLSILSISLALIANSLYWYLLIFFLIGASMDGNRIASGNLILIIAPEEKRPIYNALQTNITSFGMFFSLIGGVILYVSNYTFLYWFAIIALLISFYFSFKLKDI